MTWLPQRLSVSAVDLYTRCPAAYRRRYLDGVQDPPTPPMAFGRVMAHALEQLHRGADGDLAFVLEYGKVAQELQASGQTMSPRLKHGLALLDLYRQRGIEQGEPEARFELHLPSGLVPVPILGYLDVLTPTAVIEFKTSAGGWDQGRADSSPQAAVYRWAYTRLTGRKPQEVRFIVMSTRAARIDEYVTYPAGPEIQLWELQAATVWRGVRDGHFEPKCRRCPACLEAGIQLPLKAPAPTWEMPE